MGEFYTLLSERHFSPCPKPLRNILRILPAAALFADGFKPGLSFAAVTDTNLAPVTGIPLSFQKLGNNLILSWTNSSFSLQSAGTVTGVYNSINGAATPYTNPITITPKFFRLKSN